MAESTGLTIGVEEEFQIVDPGTRGLKSKAGRIVPRAAASSGSDDEVSNELYLSQVEVGTPVCHTLADARRELVRLRKAVLAAAEAEGLAIASAGLHPFSTWEEQDLTPKDRYRGILEHYQQLTREQVIFGCHVHVGIDDREAAIRAMDRSRPWLPVILALSANSPFSRGADTGYASFRTEIFGRFPLTGLPDRMASRADFDRLVADLVALGVVEDASKIYWDVRPSMHFETIEFRVADVAQTVDEAVMIAGLCRGLAAASADRPDDPAEPDPRPEILQVARWHAARHGLDATLLDIEAGKPRPAAEVVGQLLEYARPGLERLGDWDEVSGLVDQTLRRGNGASRQRAAYERTGRFEDVVDAILGEFRTGLG